MKAQVRQKDNDSLKLSQDEIRSFHSAFESEEFRNIFSNYVDEISDPKVRAEQDAYIKKLEQGQTGIGTSGVPAGKKLIWPDIDEYSFVVKRRILYDEKKTSASHAESKLFINFICSAKIDPPSHERACQKDEENKMKWLIPHALGPMRMEMDKSNNRVPTFDACFHPYALKMTKFNDSFRSMLIEIASCDIVRYYRESLHETVSLNQEICRVLKGVIYVNGKPPALMVSDNEENDTCEVRDNRNGQGSLGMEKGIRTDPQQSFQSISRGFLSSKGKFPSKNKKQNLLRRHTKIRGNSKIITPTYKLKEQTDFDISDHTNGRGCGERCFENRIPEKLVVEINLPKVEKASELSLDIDENHLTLRSAMKNFEVSYFLNLQLPYRIYNGSAKWDKQIRILRVELPIKQKNAS